MSVIKVEEALACLSRGQFPCCQQKAHQQKAIPPCQAEYCPMCQHKASSYDMCATFFSLPGVFFHSRATWACPVTTGLIMAMLS